MSEEKMIGDAARTLAASRKKEPRVCARCGREFLGYPWAKHCGRVCLNAAWRERNKDELNRKRRERYAREKAETPPAARPPGRPRKVEG